MLGLEIWKISTAPLAFLLIVFSSGCTQETQNKFSRAVQNWTGTDGVLEVYAGEKLVHRFIKIDKLSTAASTQGKSVTRPYRYGYGVADLNYNFKADEGEKKVYFEFSDYSTHYIFFQNPH
ncbi:MAG TPA: hypothetical protein DCR17_07990 [Verrucomicrobiales bacterium]|nr:hypothetical protein [Pedosphaera sp.]MBL6841907.1 hypothetical protein [Verrucomicrobiae bacterium]RZO71695.1 MAG: hypothetical protein EVA71_05695 [Limisphaerales bacterium]HAO66610.1 hypothetical protein [Verrucomicrobiales bacterium]HAQ97998.1 hypothetical protein [Verrucomicrobiales bacterium]|tara:strand:- start:1166 stop:1528 length:363 start_codon:yes stop_codon:yes gene_type:complete